VKARLEKQKVDAGVWRDICLGFFQKYSRHPLPRPLSPNGRGE